MGGKKNENLRSSDRKRTRSPRCLELKKRRTDPMSPQNVLKRSQQAKQQPRKPKLKKDYTTRAPQNYNMAITSNDPTGAMGRA